MDDNSFKGLAAWVTEAGLAGQSESELLTGFCDRAPAAGLKLGRASLIVDTLHPIHEGRVFRWQRGGEAATILEYGRTTAGAAEDAWRRSPFYRLIETGGTSLRRRVSDEAAAEFPIVGEMGSKGVTDYLAIINRFAADGVIGEIDCIYSSWGSEESDGFTEAEIAALLHLLPFLALAVKCASLGRIAETLVETYL